MVFMGWWTTQDGRTCRGLVEAESADDADRTLRSCLQTGCEVVNVMWYAETTDAGNITPQMLCVNFCNRSEYRLFG